MPTERDACRKDFEDYCRRELQWDDTELMTYPRGEYVQAFTRRALRFWQAGIAWAAANGKGEGEPIP